MGQGNEGAEGREGGHWVSGWVGGCLTGTEVEEGGTEVLRCAVISGGQGGQPAVFETVSAAHAQINPEEVHARVACNHSSLEQGGAKNRGVIGGDSVRPSVSWFKNVRGLEASIAHKHAHDGEAQTKLSPMASSNPTGARHPIQVRGHVCLA